MDIIRVPQDTRQQPQIAAGNITFLDYTHPGGSSRNRVLFDSYAFSFVQCGQKRIYLAGGQTSLTPGFGLLIPVGNSIIVEHSGAAEPYQSFVIFFPGQMGRDFIAAHPARQAAARLDTPYMYFQTNAYIREYVRNIRTLIAGRQTLSAEVAELKVQELLTVMFEVAPEILIAMFGRPGNPSLKSLVENNLLNPLTLEELAFLANRSLSSFKRDFQKTYGLAPQKYIRDRRLEMAGTDLASGKLASEIYLDYGYQHLPNFNTAFKRKFGVTPADYRETA